MTHNKGLIEISDELLHQVLHLPHNWRLTGDLVYDSYHGVWRLNVIGSDIPNTEVGQLLPRIVGTGSIDTKIQPPYTEIIKWEIV